jgi:hypothetical protein
MKKSFLLFLLVSIFSLGLQAQDVPILDYTINLNGQIQITVASTSEHYYVLRVRHTPIGDFEQATAIVLGQSGTTTFAEPLAAYPIDHYKVTEYLRSSPADIDQDGIDDITELSDLGTKSPLNAAASIDFINGIVNIPDYQTFKLISFYETLGNPIPALNNIELVKFFIKDREAAEPKLYFVNSNTHDLHTQFANALGFVNDGTLMTGTIAYHPNIVGSNGNLGIYRFFFQPTNLFSFALVQKSMELLAANMPFLENNLSYYPLEQAGLPLYFQEKPQYDASRVSVLFESDLFFDVDYVALNAAEGYGLLRVMDINERPNSRDVVLYESLPNEMSRVGGIITTVMQTPLSHVNLRAIQDNIPNAFIRDALQLSGVDSLLGKYVYFKAEVDNYTLREATLQEVNAYFDSIRPTEAQIPPRDLTKTTILPLDSIFFDFSASYGVKCANVATMRGFGFPDNTIPNGFGIPFYFYDEFMKYNNFYTQAQNMISDVNFQTNYELQAQMLANFRTQIKSAAMPNWMLDALTILQQSFPTGTSIRCRSSTNNEDLPGFSGAGLYDSRTHRTDEGHLSKTIKQIYASMWNFRAYDERDFYRIDHFIAAMGILVHPNFDFELANGVGVTIDPLYNTDHTFYLNTQLGENLVTNPNALSIPEEIILDAISTADDDFFVVNPSNQVPQDTMIMKKIYLSQMRGFLQTIHEKFEVLYDAVGKPGFAMEIEYKINAENQLIIKQARPWVGYWVGGTSTKPTLNTEALVEVYPNPFTNFIHIKSNLNSDFQIEIYDAMGRRVKNERIDFYNKNIEINLENLNAGFYFMKGIKVGGNLIFSKKLVKY